MFQKIILPLFPHYHGGNGLLAGTDSVFFHKIAVKLAQSIRAGGWEHWTLRPAEGATGNVSLLAALYAVFGADPAVMVPLNAAVHATSGLVLFLLARELWPGKVGSYAGFTAACLFILFPSALNWYAQIHKDGFAILGMLIIFYSWLKGFHTASKPGRLLWLILGNVVGVSLVIFVRPYNIKLLMMSAVIVFCATLIYLVITKRAKLALKGTGIFIVLIIFFALINSLMPGIFITGNKSEVIRVFREQGINWTWQHEKMPAAIDRVLENATLVRMMNIYHAKLVNAGSVIDSHVQPEDSWSVLAYLPRAAFIGLFSPFPNRWFSPGGVLGLVSALEMIVWYLCVPGLIMTFWYRRSLELILMALNILVFLTILGFTNPIVGTLYRFRYVYLFILITIGIMGWAEFTRRNFKRFIPGTLLSKRESSAHLPQPNEPEINSINPKSMVLTAGFTVVAFTLLLNILLVARDIVLARWFGLGTELDAFFIAMTIPMFLVSVLSIPIGTVVIPPLMILFQKDSKTDTQRFITRCSQIIFGLMLFFTVLLYGLGTVYIPIIGWGFPPEKLALSYRLLNVILPILFFSGFVILGNSILNARKKFLVPALAQAVVPIVAIFALMVASKYIGIYAMAIGMVAGQVANLIIVSFYVRKEGYTFFPFSSRNPLQDRTEIVAGKISELRSQYVPLVLAALFVSIALPVNNMMAASLAPGSVSAFNLGLKFVMFFTGLVGTGISTVMLPHFSHYFAIERLADVRHELSFFVIITMLVSLPLTVLVSLLSPLLVKLILYGGLFTNADTGVVTKIMQYGLLQMPFFCIGMILTKYANARRKNYIIAVTSLAGLAINVLLNFVFMRTMGIAGIALATSFSIILSTGLFVIAGYYSADIQSADLFFLALTTAVYLVFFLYNYYFNVLGIITTVIVFLITIVLRFIRVREYARDCAGVY